MFGGVFHIQLCLNLNNLLSPPQKVGIYCVIIEHIISNLVPDFIQTFRIQIYYSISDQV